MSLTMIVSITIRGSDFPDVKLKYRDSNIVIIVNCRYSLEYIYFKIKYIYLKLGIWHIALRGRWWWVGDMK